MKKEGDDAKAPAQATSQRRALLTGVTGQDGSYLSELLLAKGYEVHGIVRRSSSFNTGRVDHLYKDTHEYRSNFYLHFGDLTDGSCLLNLLIKVKPHEVYNLGAQSHVKVSFEMPEYTANVNALGTLRLLDAIRSANMTNDIRFYQASTSELYGKAIETPQTETTPFCPQSPYAVAKQFAHWTTKNYREAYNIFACNGILFNHESPRRGPTFVTRKVTRAIARILKGTQNCLFLGNLDARRDWGHAKEYVEAMWLMLQQEKADDFVIASGENHPVREFVELAFDHVDITIVWEGSGVEEIGKSKESGEVLIRIDPQYYRPTEVDALLGNATKAHKMLNWKPKISFKDLVKEMVEADIELLKSGDENS